MKRIVIDENIRHGKPVIKRLIGMEIATIVNDINKLTFTMCHCEPFAFCHSDPVSSTGEESHYFAQDKLREGRYDPRRFAPRNDYFSGSFTIIKML